MATGRGHVFKGEDLWRGRMIEMLLCSFRIETAEIVDRFGVDPATIADMYAEVDKAFPGMTRTTPDGFEIVEEGRPLARMIARAFDGYEMRAEGHSAAF
jgi:oxygen-independent coproporphyrinogen-3 oxidase